jgi:uncharacterized protein
MKHLSNWIEIPVKDMTRATAFYQAVLQEQLQPMELGPVHYALFPSEDRFNCGALAQGEGYQPDTRGVTVYLDGGEDLDARLSRVQKAGGTVVMPKTYLGKDAGHIALFIDCEGNRIGLQSA